jgi:hypothetical protein
MWVTGEIIERMRQAVDGELGHRSRDRGGWLANLAANAIAVSKTVPDAATSSTKDHAWIDRISIAGDCR